MRAKTKRTRRRSTELTAAPLRFVVEEGPPRDRLDRLLVTLLGRSGLRASRATVQRWLEAGRVTVEGGPAKASSSVALGTVIEVTPDTPPTTQSTPDAGVEFTIVHEDEHLVVVDKPAGLVVHPSRGHEDGTLVNGLLSRCRFAAVLLAPDGPSGHLRPGIVHRLDRGTSGLLVVAKTEAAREQLREAFRRHDITREYVAVVVGEARSATYDTLHGRHPTDRLRFTSKLLRGRRATTHVRALEHFGALATLVACTLGTGRTHQLRVHLTERSGTPILGDPLYGRAPRDAELRRLGEELGHQALHARRLGFRHPATGAQVEWESPVPADVAATIAALRALAATRAST